MSTILFQQDIIIDGEKVTINIRKDDNKIVEIWYNEEDED